jgi:hypothetical protein
MIKIPACVVTAMMIFAPQIFAGSCVVEQSKTIDAPLAKVAETFEQHFLKVIESTGVVVGNEPRAEVFAIEIDGYNYRIKRQRGQDSDGLITFEGALLDGDGPLKLWETHVEIYPEPTNDKSSVMLVRVKVHYDDLDTSGLRFMMRTEVAKAALRIQRIAEGK